MSALPADIGLGAAEIYRYAAAVRDVSVDELAARCGVDRKAAEAAVGELTAVGLLAPAPDHPGRLVAVSPAVAAMCHLAPREHQLRDEQRRLARLRDQLEALLPLYRREDHDPRRPGTVEELTEPQTVRAVMADLASRCQDELLTSQPGGARSDTLLPEGVRHLEQLLARGVRVRSLYQHAAQFSAATSAHIDHITGLGAQVRIVGGELLRMLVFDRYAAVVSLRDRPDGAVLVQHPSVVDFVATAFEHSWVGAEPGVSAYDHRRSGALSTKVKLSIVHLLAEGHSDKTIARRLGISERTCQRHIAEVFERIGARSRFHAGYLISQIGLGAAVEAIRGELAEAGAEPAEAPAATAPAVPPAPATGTAAGPVPAEPPERRPDAPRPRVARRPRPDAG